MSFLLYYAKVTRVDFLQEGSMNSFRFVAVPAVPTETESLRTAKRAFAKVSALGFNIYDNEDKRRLKTNYLTRVEAERECERLNI